jgi:hypothetical protein
MFNKEKLTQGEIKKLKEVATEYNKLKKCLAVGQAEYDYDTKTYNLVQRLDLDNPIVKQLNVVEAKVNLIMDHLGLAYTDRPNLVKMKKCFEE